MTGSIEFDEDKINYGVPRSVQVGGIGQFRGYNNSNLANLANQPMFVRWLMKHGLAKSPATAQVILVVVVVINIIITFIVLKYFL